jgi:drug/metabolite transporter (DMT)-like permease
VKRLAVIALIWGWSFLFIKVAVEGMTPTAVAGARIFLGAVVMLAVVRSQKIVLPRDRTTWRHLLVMGVMFNVLPFTFLAWGEERITSALAAVLNATTPLFAAVMTAVVLGERLRRVQLVGVVLGFVGVAIAAGVGGDDLAGSSVEGSLAVIAAAVCYGFGFTYARRNLGETPPLVAATGQLVMGTLVIAPFAIGTTVVEGIDLAPHRLLAIVLLGALGTGYAHLLNYRSIAEVGPTRASVVTQLVPVVAVTVGVLFLGEPFHLRLLAGAALTLFGIALLHDRIRRFRTVPVAT